MLADIQAALDTQMAAFGGDIAWEGVPFVFEAGKSRPYIAVSNAARSAQTIGVGPAAPRFWSGTYQTLVAHPVNEGLAGPYATADLLLQHFPRGLTLSSGAARVVIERGSVGPTYSTSDWINVPVQFAWYCEDA